MINGDSGDRRLQELISEELEAVTFVRDYVQLQFGTPPTLNVYTPITVRSQGAAWRTGEPGFAEVLVAQIDKRVRDVRRQPSRRLEILFDDASAIDISLRSEDYPGPEAFQYFGKHGDRLVE